MTAHQPQPDGATVDISVEKRGDVNVGVHVQEAPSQDKSCRLSANDSERKMETQRQAWFENAIKDKLKIPNSYEEVSVLMVRWHPDIDDYRVGHDHEIANLKRVFQNRFGFSVAPIVCLGSEGAKPQNTLNLAIAQHIASHDGANKLMIVYYTGHGALVGDDRRLAFAATNDAASELMKDPHSVAYWDTAEELLLKKGVEPDVLTILDCCFASSGHKGCNDNPRTYDLLAACDKNEETPAPGVNSFTHRLIDTLNRLLDEPGDQRILTTRLLDEMNKGCETRAHLFDRLKKNDGRYVQLKPVTRQSKREIKQLAIDFKDRAPEVAGVHLRFSLQDRKLLQDRELSKQKIEDWAEALIHACKSVGLPLRRIDWMKMEDNNPGERFQRIVELANLNKNNPKQRFRRAIETVILDNQNRARRTNKRNRSKDPSPVTPKRQASDKLLTPLTRTNSRLLTPESNAGEHHG